MHIAVVIGIIAFWVVWIFRGMFTNYYAGLSKLMLMVTGFVYIFLCPKFHLCTTTKKNSLVKNNVLRFLYFWLTH